MSWQPPSEDWQSALEQPDDWQKRLREQGSVPQAPVWHSPEPAPAPPAPAPAEAPSAPPPAPAAPPTERPWQPAGRIDVRLSAPGAAGALVLGILGLGFWFLGPFAWWQGVKALRAIRRSGGQMSGSGVATLGMVLGILETVAMVLVTALIVIGFMFTAGEPS